ncbi:selection and upkeep of intraepithelial T-cells protein 7 [Lates calcarifer]|uniref:Selection and upkeep of intraepithelial T-cells protein 7 n=1 Tax=Lates calcarifer TaxID=8187 RepID=A0AAJ7PSU6_LATCA|nr:selection and upkeep of intraepithelial T-cells protein 7 [Lates calcarifer]
MAAETFVLLWWTSLFLCLLVSASEDQKNITAVAGQNVTLPCKRYRPISNRFGVQWTRSDLEPEYIFFQRGRFLLSNIVHPSFKNRVELKDSKMKNGDVSLILKNVTSNDTGRYECRVFKIPTCFGSPTYPISIINLDVRQSGNTTENIWIEENEDEGNEYGEYEYWDYEFRGKYGKNKDVGNDDGENKYGRNEDGGNTVRIIKDEAETYEDSRVVVGLVAGLSVVAVVAVVVALGIFIYKRHMKKNPHLRPADEAGDQLLM